MRLDHLLSKERHPSKGGMEPRLPVLGDGVLIGRRHWLVGFGSGLMLLYTLSSGGGWKGLMMRLGLAMNTLLGPEGMTVWLFLGLLFL